MTSLVGGLAGEPERGAPLGVGVVEAPGPEVVEHRLERRVVLGAGAVEPDGEQECWRELFVSALAKRVPSVLEALRATSSPTPADAQSAKRALISEFTEHVDDQSEPTATGRELDDLVGYFINRFTMT
jgi:hypothetical protein